MISTLEEQDDELWVIIQFLGYSFLELFDCLDLLLVDFERQPSKGWLVDCRVELEQDLTRCHVILV